MTLLDRLNAKLNSNLGDDQGPWRQFILDHVDYIRSNSKLYAPDAAMMYRYKHDLVWYLNVEMERNLDMAWIFLLINDLGSEMEFVEPKSYYVPTDDLIEELYTLYITTSQEN